MLLTERNCQKVWVRAADMFVPKYLLLSSYTDTYYLLAGWLCICTEPYATTAEALWIAQKDLFSKQDKSGHMSGP